MIVRQWSYRNGDHLTDCFMWFRQNVRYTRYRNGNRVSSTPNIDYRTSVSGYHNESFILKLE